MHILSVESAFPEHYVEKRQIVDFVKERQRSFASPTELSRLEKLHQSVGVQGRHFALPLSEYETLRDSRHKHARQVPLAAALGTQAVTQALQAAGLAPSQIDHFMFASSSVMSCPTVDAHIVDTLAMRSDIKRTPLLGLGCAGGLIGLSRAADYLFAYPNEAVIVCAVELTSFVLHWEDCSINAQGNIGLFGDASAAAVLVGAEHPLALERPDLRPTIVSSRSAYLRGTCELVHIDPDADGLHLTMAHDVAERIGASIRREVETFLADHHMTLSDIGSWICHPGGPQTIGKISEALDLPAATTALMRSTLQARGNIASANILVLLQTYLREHRPAPGTFSVALTYGPGFAYEFVLLRW